MSKDDRDEGFTVRTVSADEMKKVLEEAEALHRTRIKDLLLIPSDGVTEVNEDEWDLLRVKIASSSDIYSPSTEGSPLFRIYREEKTNRFHLQRLDEEQTLDH